jgi:hypothetical protein
MITNNDSFDDLSTLHRSEFECVIDVLAFTNRLCKLIFMQLSTKVYLIQKYG